MASETGVDLAAMAENCSEAAQAGCGYHAATPAATQLNDWHRGGILLAEEESGSSRWRKRHSRRRNRRQR